MAVETQEQPGIAQAQKPVQLSRYRSVRRAASQKQMGPNPETPTAPVPPIPAEHARPKSAAEGAGTQQGPTVARSMSRYRRQRNPAASNTLPPPVPARFYTPDGSEKQGNTDQSWQGTSRSDKTGDVKPSLGEKQRPSEEDELARAKHRENAMKSLTGDDTTKSKPQNTTRKHEDKTASPKGEKPRALKDKKPAQPKGKAPLNPPESGGNVMDQVDAPVSAVNAGERKVLVQYRKSSIHLSVTPSTTVQDLLYLAQASFSDEIDAKFIVIESFTQLALERPLRKYECIRDIMNSWGHDGQNVLIILPPASLEAVYNLEMHSAPEEQPVDTTFHIYHSQRSRKWEKRYVTLRADGQVTLAKKYQAKEQSNICHLSDFDVYSPSSSALSNDVKPPKRICYAVKSQQKASMFLTTDNYVHYFCTNDREIAEGWYKAIQAWRSWYLARVLGAGQLNDEAGSLSGVSRKGSVASSGSNHPKASKLLEFDPIERERIAKPLSSPVERSKSFKKAHLLAIDTKKAGLTQDPNGSPFSPTGLLGQMYTVRQQAMHEQEESKKAQNEAFFSQGLVSGAGARTIPLSQPSSRSNTMTGTRDPDLTRSKSLSKSKQKPLVDLAPIYPEPPQYTRKGKGVTVGPGMPLVDAATGPDLGPNAIVVPPSTDWKRPPIPEEPQHQHQQPITRSNTTRSARYRRPDRACPGSPISSTHRGMSSSSPNKAFIAHGLLARSASSKPSAGRGQGPATGDRNAAKPMLDVSPANPFVQGSLLRDL